MAKKLTVKEQLLKDYDFITEDDFYPEKRSGKDIIKHSGCERIARNVGIKYAEPRFLTVQRDFSVLYCAATLEDRMEWTIGEADLNSNCFNKYVHSMAEKRCKDRLILKLIGVYGDIYSDTEDFVDDINKPNNEPQKASDKQKKYIATLLTETGSEPITDEDYDKLTKQEGGQLIEKLLALPKIKE